MALRFGDSLPSIEGSPVWVNTPLTDSDLQGVPVVVAFWALSCPFCIEHLQSWQSWHNPEEASGVRVLAIHSPRVKTDKKVDLDSAAQQLKVYVPCAWDKDKTLAARFQIDGIWPHYFFFDRNGSLRSRAAGGRGWSLVESALHRSLGNPFCNANPAHFNA